MAGVGILGSQTRYTSNRGAGFVPQCGPRIVSDQYMFINDCRCVNHNTQRWESMSPNSTEGSDCHALPSSLAISARSESSKSGTFRPLDVVVALAHNHGSSGVRYVPPPLRQRGHPAPLQPCRLPVCLTKRQGAAPRGARATTPAGPPSSPALALSPLTSGQPVRSGFCHSQATK